MVNKIKKTLLILIISILLAIGIIVFMECLSSNRNVITSDKALHLSIEYFKSIDICKLFSQKNEIMSVATKYSVLYKNNNHRTMYISSVPIRSVIDGTYCLIDNSIQKPNDNLCSYNDGCITTYKSDKISLLRDEQSLDFCISNVKSIKNEDLTTTTGEVVDAIHYYRNNNCDVWAYQIFNCIMIECDITSPTDNISFPVNVYGAKISNRKYGGIVLSKKDGVFSSSDNERYYVISQPVIIHNSGIKETCEIASINNNELNISLNYIIEYPYKIVFGINYYRENMFFDCAVYKQQPKSNFIFDNYIVYKTNDENQTRNYMKFNVRSFTPKKSDNLEKITLNLYVLYCTNNMEFEVYSIKNDWCSWEIVWNKQPMINEKIGEYEVTAPGWYSLDITDYVKNLIDNNYYNLVDNSLMITTKRGTNGHAIFTSTDNNEHSPFFEVSYNVE